MHARAPTISDYDIPASIWQQWILSSTSRKTTSCQKSAFKISYIAQIRV